VSADETTVCQLVCRKESFMKTEIEITGAAVSSHLRFNTSPAPSLRLPVTAANRALLRRLRTEELSAWEAGRICAGGYFPSTSRGPPEHRFI
jgi:hypothetical protein